MMTQKIVMISDLHLRRSTLETYITPKIPKTGFFVSASPKLPDNMSVYTNKNGDTILFYMCPEGIKLSDYADLRNVPADLVNLMKWMKTENINFVEFHNTHKCELTTDEMIDVFKTESFLPFYDIPEKYVHTYQEYIQSIITAAQSK